MSGAIRRDPPHDPFNVRPGMEAALVGRSFPGSMNLDHTREIIHSHGIYAGIHDLVYRAANHVTPLLVLRGMSLTLDTLDPSYLEGDPSGWGFLEQGALLERIRSQPTDMTEDFIEEATARGDRCYGVVIDDALASYGWYSTAPTPVDDDLCVHFDPSHAYMYKGFTLPEYRGKRLHGIGMARALAALTAEGSRGLVSYVKSNNFASLKSCYRMGYRDFGVLLAARVNGRHVTYATRGCEPYGFRLEAIASRRPPISHFNRSAPAA